jgi:ribosomal protein L37AE/L43A
LVNNAWNSFEKSVKKRLNQNYYFLSTFRKHCINTEENISHNCLSKEKDGEKNCRFIVVYSSDSKRDIKFVICENCKKVYYSSFILARCYKCKVDYYTSLLYPEENPEMLLATWENYHCPQLINEKMKCINCHEYFYLNMKTGLLNCLNKKCGFISKPNRILWTCCTCKKEFKSGAIPYNPLDIQVTKKLISQTLSLKHKAHPKKMVCGCKLNVFFTDFYHNKKCEGILYESELDDNTIIVCEKCKMITYIDRFIWTCPKCEKKFKNGLGDNNNYLINPNENLYENENSEEIHVYAIRDSTNSYNSKAEVKTTSTQEPKHLNYASKRLKNYKLKQENKKKLFQEKKNEEEKPEIKEQEKEENREENKEKEEKKEKKGKEKEENKDEKKDEEKKDQKNEENKGIEEEKNEVKKDENNHNIIRTTNLNKGNEIIINKKKDAILIEVNKERSSQNSYEVFQLSLINENNINKFNSNITQESNEIKILCFRRYNEFNLFYETLKKRFPQCIFPRLSQKNFIKSKIQDDPNFIEKRRKELQFFINKLYFNDQINNSEEFKKFIYCATFDSDYYKNRPKKYSYPECDKIYNDKGYFNKGWKKVASYFNKSTEVKRSEIEAKIFQREEEFKNKLEQYNNLLKEIKVLFDTTDEKTNIYENISNNLLFLKDDISSSSYSYSKNDNEFNKNKFNVLINLNKNISDIFNENKINLLSKSVDQLDYCILYVEGVIRGIERYNSFCDKYRKIKNIEGKNSKGVIEEKQRIENDKIEFEKILYDEIQKYDKEYKNIYEEIIQQIFLYINVINESEQKAFQDSTFDRL